MKLVPGKREVMPLTIWGDKRKNQTENAIFNLWSHNLNVQIAPGYTYVSDNAISIHGTTETNATIGIETIDPRVVYAVEVLPCPPGFVTHSTSAASVTTSSEASCVAVRDHSEPSSDEGFGWGKTRC